MGEEAKKGAVIGRRSALRYNKPYNNRAVLFQLIQCVPGLRMADTADEYWAI